ncbi:DUF2513 domain-containing protein [Clostridium cadaveris]|uniref:DUF2513 domain-containing protein n=1 Tax=Clostridium cadaveris TaxID=1529 RepID=UPI00040A6943|nr:DUF2513 domain-containing protein [Clostridium cadaveris]
MKLNPDCIREVLTYIEENQTYVKGTLQRLHDTDICNEITKFSRSDVLYSIKQLSNSNMLDSHIIKTAADSYIIYIFDITPSGHEFLANIRTDNVWNQTKKIANKVGSFSLDVLTKISVSIVTELIKQNIMT